MRFEIEVLTIWAFVAVFALAGCLAIYWWHRFYAENRPMPEDEWRARFEPNLPNTNNPVPPDDASDWAWPVGDPDTHYLWDDGSSLTIVPPKNGGDDAA